MGVAESKINLETGDGLAVLRLSNPPLNLVDAKLLADLRLALSAARTDETIRVLIVAAEGERAFCAGSDLRTTLALKTAGRFVEDKLRPETDIFSELAEFPQPTIAVLSAAALGGGLELASCCDLIVAGAGIRIGLPEINVAGFPPTGVVRLARRTTLGRINQLVLLGQPISAETALDWGIVDAVATAPETALGLAQTWAARFAELPPRALQLSKRAIAVGQGGDSRGRLDDVLKLSDILARAGDAIEGPTAFLAKRSPRFSDQPLADYERRS